jgi:putative methyltransferase (TIGR04325 family)
MNAKLKAVALAVLPPIVVSGLRHLVRREYVPVPLANGTSRLKPEWEMVHDTDEVWSQSEGWSHASIANRQSEKWNAFLADLASPGAFGRSHEAAPDAPIDVGPHNTIMTFAYVMGRVLSEVAQGSQPSVLDWGGGIGHYYRYAMALYPDASLRYVIKDLQALCEAGRPLNPGAVFEADETKALATPSDLVFASSSLHYTRDVYRLTERLLDASRRYFMVTRTPFVEQHDDFVVVQRPYRYGYMTEYAAWFLNRSRFVSFVTARGFILEREFLLSEQPYVPNAPEQCRYRGFLFKHS